ncbi:putative transcriptional regulatory protein [Mycobacterium tuberculosis RGTB423]|nr:putative transcriptional regulatory protein [Mycobacterium tuberculosis RGTB423]
MTGGQPPSEAQVRQAAWIARCVGRGGSAPLHRDDVSALAETLQAKEFAPGAVVFHADQTADGVWIVRHGLIELAVGSRRRRAVVNILHPGDVDGDIPLLLEMPMVYTGRALTQATCLFLDRQAFERLLATHPAIARRWLSSVAQRVSTAQIRLMGMLGRPLPAQVAAAPARRGNRCPYRTCPTHPRRNAWSAAPIDQQDSQGVRARPIDHRRVCGHRDHRPTRITRPGSMTQRRSHGPQRQHVGAEFVH